MKDELANELYDKFPTVLTETCEVTGIVTKCHLDIGDGWYDLVVAICNGVLSNQDRVRAANIINQKPVITSSKTNTAPALLVTSFTCFKKFGSG